MLKPKTIVTIFAGRNGKWYFRATARNNEKIASSQSYTRRSDAVRGALRAFSGGGAIRFA